MKIIERVKAALTGEQRADVLDELNVKLRMYANQKGERLKAIVTKDGDTFAGGPGPERQKVIAEGDVEALRALDDEERDLVAEMEVLRSLQKRLRAHLDATRAHEFVKDAPERYTELTGLLETEIKVQAALQAARKATEGALRDLTAQRQHVARARNLEFPAADSSLLKLLMDVRGYSYSRGPERIGWYAPGVNPGQLRQVAEALGVDVPHPGRESVAA